MTAELLTELSEAERLSLQKNIAFYLGKALVDAHKAGRMPTTTDCMMAAELALTGIAGCGYTLHRRSDHDDQAAIE